MFLHNNNEHAEKFRKKVSFTTVSKNETKCLELKPKEIKLKPFMIKLKDNKEKKWKKTLFHDRINVVKKKDYNIKHTDSMQNP